MQGLLFDISLSAWVNWNRHRRINTTEIVYHQKTFAKESIKYYLMLMKISYRNPCTSGFEYGRFLFTISIPSIQPCTNTFNTLISTYRVYTTIHLIHNKTFRKLSNVIDSHEMSLELLNFASLFVALMN